MVEFNSLRADLRANRGHPKEQMIVLSLRLSQAFAPIPVVGSVVRLAHRFWTELIYGIELRPETKIGPGLRIYHGYGTVVNTGSVLGANVKLHHGVTIGARRTGGDCPVIGDNVEIGAGAIILGGISIGNGAAVGAGAVVLHDIPPGAMALGSTARVVMRSVPATDGAGD